MGVPKFYRWISERYPCLSETIKEYQIPEFDNLYLDMNGIIHVCSHPNDDDPHFRISEEQIFKDIFHYIEVLFRMIQPREIFFMAIDGVAPRAKMNQQRGRRFRSAREADENEKKALAKGEVLPKEARFDSNCITPGTEFMTKLDEQLQFFVTNKISTDPLWKSCSVIYSGHKTPGEGEHKIMEYIRYSRCQPGYNKHTRHCLYGLDADLIMLGLTSHEPHFSLLREEVRFDKKYPTKRTPTPEETTFHLLHLSLMREYLNYEFAELHNVPFGFDLEAIIDDWVFMGFLVGNDFIPHLPAMHINKEALPILYYTYKQALPTLDGYLNEGGTLNLPRFEKFMEKLSEYDREKFSEENANLKYLASKSSANERASRLEEFQFDEAINEDQLGALEGEDEKGLTSAEVAQKLAQLGVEPSGFSDSDELDEEDTEEEEFRMHKRNYYMEKMEIKRVDAKALRDQATNYVRGLQWILHYYYNGITSWSWYYPYHYAPYISDIRSFADVDMTFEKGSPFLPFEQLLGVLPPKSISLLPTAYHWLMLDEASPLKEFYPEDFKTDLNGKQQDWEAVVLIPFLDEKKMLKEMKEVYNNLTEDEKLRNSHGPMYIYNHTTENLGEYKAPAYFPAVSINHASIERVLRDEWDIDPSRFIKGLLPGVESKVFFAGFPTLKYIDHKFRVAKDSVKVFQQYSRGDNYILEISKKEAKPLKEIANSCVGKTIFVNWPHLLEAKISYLTDGKTRYSFTEDQGIICEAEEPKFKDGFNIQRVDLKSRLHARWGIDTSEVHILAYAKILSGRKYVITAAGKVTQEKEWDIIDQPFAYQLLVFNLPVHESGMKQFIDLDSYFFIGSKVFMLGQPYYGSMGEVIGSDSEIKGRIRVTMISPHEPNFEPVKFYQQNCAMRYMTSYEAATRLSMSVQLFARITGTILLSPSTETKPFQELEKKGNVSKLNIGLNLKSNARNEESMFFTRKCQQRNIWLYSDKCVEAVRAYHEAFPEIFDFLHKGSGAKDLFHENDIFPKNYKEKVPELSKWIKASEFHKAERCPCGSVFLENEVTDRILEEVDKVRNLRAKCVRLQVKPHLLYRPNLYQGSSPPDKSVTFELFDRVINIREGFSVPLGARGTVVGIQPREKAINYLYDILFDEPFTGGLTLYGPASAKRCYKLHWANVLSISHGERKNVAPSYKGGPVAPLFGSPVSSLGTPKKPYVNPTANFARSTGSQSSQTPPPHLQTPPPHLLPKTNGRPIYPESNQRTNHNQPRESHLANQTYYNSNFDQRNNRQTFDSSKQTPPQNFPPTSLSEVQSPHNVSEAVSSKALPPDAALLPSPAFKKSEDVSQKNTPKRNQSQNVLTADDVPFVLHGNFFHNWQSIQKKGLRRDEKREFVPCVSYVPPSIGLRSYQLHIYLDVAKLLADNFPLLRLNENQVLCGTNPQGYIPPYYFKKVVDTQSGTIIFPLGKPSGGLCTTPHGGGLPNRQLFKTPPNAPLNLHQTIWSQMHSDSSQFKPAATTPDKANNFPTKNDESTSTGQTIPTAEGKVSDTPSVINNTTAATSQDVSPSSRFVPIQVIRNKTTRKTPLEEPAPAPTSVPSTSHLVAKVICSPAAQKPVEESITIKPKKAIKNRLAVNFDGLKNSQ